MIRMAGLTRSGGPRRLRTLQWCVSAWMAALACVASGSSSEADLVARSFRAQFAGSTVTVTARTTHVVLVSVRPVSGTSHDSASVLRRLDVAACSVFSIDQLRALDSVQVVLWRQDSQPPTPIGITFHRSSMNSCAQLRETRSKDSHAALPGGDARR